jgi:hypothetical protein
MKYAISLAALAVVAADGTVIKRQAGRVTDGLFSDILHFLFAINAK